MEIIDNWTVQGLPGVQRTVSGFAVQPRQYDLTQSAAFQSRVVQTQLINEWHTKHLTTRPPCSQRNSCNTVVFNLVVPLSAALLHSAYCLMIQLSYGPDTTRKGAACRNCRFQALLRSAANKAFLRQSFPVALFQVLHILNVYDLQALHNYYSQFSKQKTQRPQLPLTCTHTPVFKLIWFLHFLQPTDSSHLMHCILGFVVCFPSQVVSCMRS